MRHRPVSPAKGESVSPEDLELDLLLEGVFRCYGYDFRQYSKGSVRRRIEAVMIKNRISKVSELQHQILHRPDFFARLLPDLMITTTEMFRDPPFFKALRTEVIPALKTYPTIKIWHAGCSTGEEVYSLAIMLREEGIYDRCVIYATDINALALKAAKDGIYPVDAMRKFTQNYQQSGGKKPFSEYYTSLYGSVKLDASLRDNIVFTDHNLVTDDVFSEMNLILCRNVLIYFERELQNRVLDLFTRSLPFKGYLCLGEKESLSFSSVADHFSEVVPRVRIYQKLARSYAGP